MDAIKQQTEADAFDRLEESLAKAHALVTMTYGNQRDVFENLSIEIQDGYMWALAGFIKEARACLGELLEQTEATA